MKLRPGALCTQLPLLVRGHRDGRPLDVAMPAARVREVVVAVRVGRRVDAARRVEDTVAGDAASARHGRCRRVRVVESDLARRDTVEVLEGLRLVKVVVGDLRTAPYEG